jgi:beta-N-acetylhexosaminidase
MTDILRGEYRFDGVAITDALQMKALRPGRGAGEMALQSLLAGSDMVLALGPPAEREGVLLFLRAALRDGRLPRDRVEESLRRILRLKRERRGECGEADDVVAEIAEASITMIGDSRGLLPLTARRVVYVGPDGPLRRRLGQQDIILPARPGGRSELRGTAVAALRRAEAWIAAAQNQEQFELIREIHAAVPSVPLIFVNLAAPHRTVRGDHALTLLTYSDADASQEAAARVIAGETPARGTLPVVLKP